MAVAIVAAFAPQVSAADAPRIRRITTLLLQPVPDARLAELRQQRRATWAKNGFVEGRDYFEVLAAPGDRSEAALERLAVEVVANRPDLIMTNGGFQTQVLHRLTRDIPIVFCCVTDPLDGGFVKSMREPGGNVTGSSSNVAEVMVKAIELVKELRPGARRVAFLNDLDPHENSAGWRTVGIPKRARELGLEVAQIRSAYKKNLEELAKELCATKADAFIAHTSTRTDLVALQRACRVPGLTSDPDLAAAGLLAGLGASADEYGWHASINIAARVLRGESPARIPVTQPLRVKLAVNVTAAVQLGIDMPASIMARADEIFR